MIPDDNRFHSDAAAALGDDISLPRRWQVGVPDPSSAHDLDQLTELLRAHEKAARGWASSGREEVLKEISEHGSRMRENLVLRDHDGRLRAWGSVHDRAAGRMLLVHVVDRDLDASLAEECNQILLDWATAQARQVGAARGVDPQQIDTGAFADDERQHAWLAAGGYRKARTWWQMSRPVRAEESALVPRTDRWQRRGVVFRRVARSGDGMPDEADLRQVHQILEGAFTDHFNSREETFAEFVHRLREEPGHRWDHWWLAELADPGKAPVPVGALVGSLLSTDGGPDGSYVDYLGVLAAARGRGVAKGLLSTIVADAAARGRDRVGLEVDADSTTGADRLYVSMGWQTRYVTESWHRDVPLG